MTAEKNKKRTLYLIDGHAQIFRAYYAIQNGMTSPVTGEATGATFAFTNMLFKFFEGSQPEHVVMAIDMPGKTFRDDLFGEYKANRKSPPEDFAEQVPRILEVTEKFGIQVIGVEGFEADDVIATIVQKTLDDSSLEDVEIKIVSRDKDLEQLLHKRVSMYDIHKDETITIDDLMAKKGIKPEQVVELQTLTGDSVDNIPGVEGIGPKTGIALVQQYGTVENLVAHLDELKGKRKEKIEAAKEMLPVYRELVTLKRDMSLEEYAWEGTTPKAIETEELRKIFMDLGFKRHINDLNKLSGKEIVTEPVKKKKPVKSSGRFGGTLFDMVDDVEEVQQATRTPGMTYTEDYAYRAVVTSDELNEVIEELKKAGRFSIDTETVGLGHRTKICGICLSWKVGEGVYVPILSPESNGHLNEATVLNALRDVLTDEKILKFGHNIKYDYLVLRYAGVKMEGVAFDSMIAAWLMEQPGLGMDDLSYAILNHEAMPISDLIDTKASRGKKKTSDKPSTMDLVPLEQITRYAAEDADLTLRLCEHFENELKEHDLIGLADDLEMPLIEVLAEMEFNGIRVDPEELDRQCEKLRKKVDELRITILDLCGCDFNVDSPKQLGDVLFNQLGFPVIRKTKTGVSTSAEVLEKLVGHEKSPEGKEALPGMIIEYRQMTKLVNTYLIALKDAIDPESKRIHASFNQTGTSTGRLSSSNPNLQNIPIRTEMGREIRKAFKAEDGSVLVSADYSQIELRVLAHLSGDENLVTAFKDGADIHAAVASQVYGVDVHEVSSEQRSHAKTINFGIIYGITPYGLARRIESLDNDGAKQLINDYKRKFPGIDSFLQQCVEEAETDGYVKTIMGRQRSIGHLDSKNPQTRALGERLAINSVVQGSAADLIKIAMVNLQRRIERESLPMKLLLQIHDELVIECAAEDEKAMASILKKEMETAIELHVPLRVDVGSGPDWYDAK
ncbi:DNA polymerase I [Poriferisphaera corsica]|uniref:DNA polymerase I n=1 Tax=Poriferisphaera corsica TaxID=2528020 RepID=A0A517YU19_9BACT|nr:DNA polymerase I [Poriferisphaera corsica]QDU33740.1 DNA polymerase I [Poriferisphaera corsica]